jgi:hypothetical protein
MGHFFAASAFKNASISDLATSITAYIRSHGVDVSPQSGRPAKESTDILLYEPRGGWTPVIWPAYFNIHDVPACAAVSKGLGSLATTVNVYDGDFWSFEFFSSGALIDKAAPRADYFAEDDDSAASLLQHWRGNPEAMAAAFQVPAESIRPYFSYLGPEDAPGKAFVDDASPLEDFWVFVDLWRRLGITYPADPESFVARLRLAATFAKRLPTWEGGDL